MLYNNNQFGITKLLNMVVKQYVFVNKRIYTKERARSHFVCVHAHT
jgi:hypothetical protein